jgi:hypothetical protein
MSELQLIRRDPSTQALKLTPECEALKEGALTESAPISEVYDDATNAAAVQAQKALSTHRRMIEKARKDVTQPLVEAKRNIDAAVAKHLEEINDEEHRIQGLLGSYLQLQEAKRKAAAEAARLEQERIEREKQQEVLRIAREQEAKKADLQRQQDEADRLARKAKDQESKAALEKLSQEIERQKGLAKAETHDQLDAINERFNNQAAAVKPPEAPKLAKGQTIVRRWNIVVNDLWTLARAHPTCVKIEPLTSQIQELLNAGVKVAGVTATEEFKSQTLGRSRTMDV